MARGPAISEAQHVRILELDAQGEAIVDIARRLNISVTAVQTRVSRPKVPAEKWAEVEKRLALGAVQKDIAEALHLSETDVSRIKRWINSPVPLVNGAAKADVKKPVEPVGEKLVEGQNAPVTPAGLGTTKMAIIRVLAQRGRIDDTRTFRPVLTGTDFHNLQHLLYTLRNQGFVSFNSSVHGKRTTLNRIMLTMAGWGVARAEGIIAPPTPKVEIVAPARPVVLDVELGAGGRVKVTEKPAGFVGEPVFGKATRHIPTTAPGGPIEHIRQNQNERPELGAATTAAVAELAPLSWPLLEALRNRRAHAERRAALIEQAAELTDDTAERDSLLTLAAAALEVNFTPLELEYLAFSAKHKA